ncbi:MAG: hypothetical protein DCC65_05955 [Planctomycetota bacterium]|nr:MAG: hypothetical protein DCC65_05955 [Planctomycetota bacterium]
MPSSYLTSCALILSVLPLGQVDREAALPPGAAGPAAAGAENTSPRSAYVDTSFEAEQTLHRIAGLEGDGQWLAAAVALQQLGRTHGRHVMAIEPDRYVSIREHVARRICAWPAEGLAAWRGAFEAPAAEALAAARDRADCSALLRIADEWFPASAGATALDLAAQCAAERGDFTTARQAYERLLAFHPDRGGHEALWRAKAAVFAARSGEPGELAALIEKYGGGASGPEVPWGGARRTLGAFLAEVQRVSAEGARHSAAATPSVFCGNSHRNGVYRFETMPEARIWKFSGFEPQQEAKDAEAIAGEPSLFDAYTRAVQSGRLLAMMPVAGDGLIFVHDQYAVWAIDPSAADRPAWTYRIREPLERSPIWLHDETIPPFFTALFHEGRLYVNLETVRPGVGEGDDELAAALVCLDGKTGRLIWRSDLADFATAFEEAALDGAPIMHDGRLYAIGRRRKGFGFEACYLLRLDPESGRLMDSIHLGEAATGSYGYRRATLAHPAASGDLIFVQTNLGSLAAVSSSLWRTAWISTYETEQDRESESFGGVERAGQPIRSWNYQPPICWKSAVVYMPLDRTDVLVLAQDDGRVLRRIGRDVLQTPQTLIGISGDLLYAAGSSIVCYDLAAGGVGWERPLEVGQLFGRGALTESGVLVPTDRALLLYPLDGGAPRVHHWSINHAGNLLPLSDQLVVAAPSLLYGLVGRDDAFALLTRRSEAGPNDPFAALALAELAFQSGEMNRGLDAVNEAVRRAGGFARLTDEETRRRLHAALTGFADALVLPRTTAPAAGGISAAIELYRMAGQCTSSTEEQIVQRFQLARALVLDRRFGEAVDAYQQVLTDPTLRRHPITESAMRLAPSENAVERGDGEDSDAAPSREAGDAAGRLAARWIGELIRRRGSEVYAATEKRAGERLQIARTQRSPAAVMEVAEAFPNSRAAREALPVHARLMREEGDLEAAVHSYRMALADRRTADRATLIHELADCLLAADRPADADAWLARGQRDFPDARFEMEGRGVGFEEYRRARLGGRDFTPPSMAIRLSPAAISYERLMSDRVAALEPLYPDAPETSWDALVTFAAGQIDCRIPGTGRSRWPRPFALASQPLLVGMDASRYFFVTASSVIALTRTSGQAAWKYGEEPEDDPTVDPESVPAWAHHVLSGDRLYLASDRGEIVCLGLEDGGVRWSLKSKAPLTAPIAADDRYVCYATWQGAELYVRAVSADDGREVRVVNPPDAWPLHSLILTRRHRLLLVRTTAITSIDMEGGKAEWTISAPEHFFLPTLQIDGDALYVSTDARRIEAYDLADGRRCWQSEPVGPRADQGMWAQQAGGAVYVAAGDRLQCLDKADGRTLWDVSCRGALKVQAPRITADAVITVSPLETRRGRGGEDEDGARGAEPASAEGEQAPAGPRFRVSRYDRESGRLLDSVVKGSPLDPGRDGRLLTEPTRIFGGICFREQAIILLDGSRIVGYVAGAD